MNWSPGVRDGEHCSHRLTCGELRLGLLGAHSLLHTREREYSDMHVLSHCGQKM